MDVAVTWVLGSSHAGAAGSSHMTGVEVVKALGWCLCGTLKSGLSTPDGGEGVEGATGIDDRTLHRLRPF